MEFNSTGTCKTVRQVIVRNMSLEMEMERQMGSREDRLQHSKPAPRSICRFKGGFLFISAMVKKGYKAWSCAAKKSNFGPGLGKG